MANTVKIFLCILLFTINLYHKIYKLCLLLKIFIIVDYFSQALRTIRLEISELHQGQGGGGAVIGAFSIYEQARTIPHHNAKNVCLFICNTFGCSYIEKGFSNQY